MKLQQKQSNTRPGMTLAELVIVLAILAITSTIAVQSMVPLADQSRIAATQQTLTAVKNAVLGSSGNASSLGATSGFVADMGRLPQNLDELLANPSNSSMAQTFSAVLESVTNASTVTVISGWKGPYITTPVGQSVATIVDGWGRTMNGPVLLSGTNWTIWSCGPNGIDDSTAFGTISNDDIPLVIYPTDYQANSIAVTAAEISGGALAAPNLALGDYVSVYLYMINAGNVTNDMAVITPGHDGLLPQSNNVIQPAATVKITASNYAFSIFGSQPGAPVATANPSYTFTFSATGASQASTPSVALTLNVGTIVLQAAHYSSNGTIKTRSVPIVTTLTPHGTLTPTLVMQ